MDENTAVIQVRGLVNQFGNHRVHDGLDLDVWQGETLGLVGGSGTGKTVLLRTLLALHQPTAGSVKLMGQGMIGVDEARLRARRQQIGMLFQNGALFGGLTILENVALPLREHTRLSSAVIEELALIKLRMAGLGPEVAGRYSNELSGGMIRRASLARALIMDPALLILDEPTAGLDPINAAAFDDLILELSDLLGLTVLMVTHDLDALWQVTDRVVYLGQGRVLETGPIARLSQSEQPEVARYFSDRRRPKEA
ncbi:phospholipid/cholesterol/gamma-HCH transport system ATP-binding protein [Natronospira proteinivora]|uniref:Phospholipid/cholesterol/gamma-HCH transport system ATP-binding protein n=1 Tax=Natronospira proteinivora TaxID=1807133 RepID=A0ABT1G902_9GAMM|nr:ATP-binding cassette domain-containing protein [Natronospira proteinivora]MCP1727804.1 phospholipid/cholesterol/gamma-HCH transport system ATP-binding protein [Natronospira proteinivora]